MELQSALADAAAVRVDDAEARWSKFAERLLNGLELRIEGRACRLVEVECYLSSPQHADPFTHCDPIQAEPGRWYLHRVGKSYKQGSFKGLDFTFGVEGAFGGVLIRSLQTPEGRVVNGPCLCVEYLMEQAGCDRVADLDARIFGPPIWDEANPLHFVERSLEARPVFATARVGLTLKRIPPALRPERFVVRRYRFVNAPRAVKKGRLHLVLALLERGWSAEDVRELTGSPLASIRRYDASRRAGAARAIDDFRGVNVDSEVLCQLHGLLRGAERSTR